MKSSSITIVVVLIQLILNRPALAQPEPQPRVEIPKETHAPFRPIDSTELASRYPKGKTWNAISIMRMTGSGFSTNWGLQGDIEFVLQNRYVTRIEILDNTQIGQTSMLKLRCDVLNASSSQVFSKERLRLASFASEDPLFNFILEKLIAAFELASPSFRIARQVFVKWESIDQDLQKSLTAIGKLLGIEPRKMLKNAELSWAEEPKIYAGYAFELEWINRFGVQSVTQVAKPDGSPDLSLDNLRSWGERADPLAELYVFPSLTKRIGDEWPLDAARATPIFSGDGDARSTGKINLKYVSDGTYDTAKVRNIEIVNGNVKVVRQEGADETSYEIDSLTGVMKVGHEDGMLRMSQGTGQFGYSKLSKNHILFKAELSRDVKAEWRYEAVQIDKQAK